jgi:hypothetical protein
MKALIGRKDIHKAIIREYEFLKQNTSPESSLVSFEHHMRNVHCLAFKCFLNQDIYDF